MRNRQRFSNLSITAKCKFFSILLFFISTIANAHETEINVKRATSDRPNNSTHTFQDQNIQTSGSSLSFTIYNDGDENLLITDITLSGINANQFKLNKTQTLLSVPPKGTTTFTLAFAPTSTSPATKNAVLTIRNNDADESTYIINLTGKAVLLAPDINDSNGISPALGAAGASITINGKELINTDSVFFTSGTSGKVAAQFTINTNTKITAVVPSNAGTGIITVKNASGAVVSSENFTFLKTYTWNKPNGNWADPSSWVPERNTPAVTDILVFDGSNVNSTTIMTAIADFLSPQTVAQIRIQNNANVTLKVAEDKVLYIGANATGTDFSVAKDSRLTVTNSIDKADLRIELKSEETGTVVGGLTFTGVEGTAEHRLIANNSPSNTNTLIFQTGSSFTAGANFAGSPFGSTYANSVQFSSTSSYNNQSLKGGSPFGGSDPVVVFDANTTYRHEVNTMPDFINRTYGNVIINNSTFNQTITGTGNLTVQRDFTITGSATNANPTLNLNLDGTITIGRNLTVTKGSLNFNPASASIIKLDGSAGTNGAVTISGIGSLNFGANTTLGIESGAVVNLGTKTVNSSGKIVINGTVKTANPNGLSGGSATSFINTQPLTLNPGSTVEYNGAGTQTVSTENYANLIISGNRGSNAITMPVALKISGVFTRDPVNTFINNNNSTIEFNGGAQTIPTLNYDNIIVSGTGDKSLADNTIINGNLKFLNKKIITGNHTLTLGPSGTITGEAAGRYVVGTLKTTRTVGSSGSDFGGMGIVLGSGVNVGDVTVIRTSGPGSSVKIMDRQGINRTWNVQPTIQPATPVSVTLSWVDDDDNKVGGNQTRDLTGMRVWKTQGNDLSTFYDASHIDQNATNRTITARVPSFSVLTVSDQYNPLPVELTSFVITKKNYSAVLNWQTATEINNSGFAVELSTDAKTYKEVGFVKSINSNSSTPQHYEFAHTYLGSGTVYYRLKQIDWNGNFKYYGPKAINFEQDNTAGQNVRVHPNPVTEANEEIIISITGVMNEKAIVTLTDALGRTIYQHAEKIAPSKNSLKINLKHRPAGIYLLTVKTHTGNNQTKILKQ